MRFLFGLDKYRRREGGADGLARGVTRALLAHGHEVTVLEAGAREETVERDGAKIHSLHFPRPRWIRDSDLAMLRLNDAWRPRVREVIEAWKPDRVLTQNMLAPATVAAARAAGVPATIFFHGYRCLDPTFYLDRDALADGPATFWRLPLREKLKWPLVKTVLARYAQAYREADRVIANSAYIARVVETRFGRSAEVSYPVVDMTVPEEPPAPNPGGALLFAKPQKIKGIETILALAETMAQRRFIVVGAASGRTRRALAARPNIDYRGWVDDMAALYAQSALLLAPARIPEPFGRVAVEAGLRGVPTVATDAGGLPEAVGEGGVPVPRGAGADRWREAIDKATANHAALSRAARAHAVDLLKTHSPQRLVEMLSG